MDKTSTNNRNVWALLEDFLDIKLEHLLDKDTMSLIQNQAIAYADSVDDYWPDHKVVVTFNPQLKD
jgi:hypothetical protein